MAIGGSSMQLRRQLWAATAQLARATWLQLHADLAMFSVQFMDYRHWRVRNNKFLVAIECAVFYGGAEAPFEPINVRKHHVSLFEVDGEPTPEEKSLLPLLLGVEARGTKMYSGQRNVCKTALLLDVPPGFHMELEQFLGAVGNDFRWADTTGGGDKLHVSL